MLLGLVPWHWEMYEFSLVKFCSQHVLTSLPIEFSLIFKGFVIPFN